MLVLRPRNPNVDSLSTGLVKLSLRQRDIGVGGYSTGEPSLGQRKVLLILHHRVVEQALLRIQAAPASLNANFRLYRTLNALCDTFSSLVDSAGNFGVREQYDPIAADLAQLDRLRHQMADRVDMLAGANDAELARLRAQVARSGGAKPGATKVVVNDGDQPAKKKAKTGQTQTQPAK